MNRFLQLHLLTAYPPSNLNRDDLGRPKTAVIGGATRLRISSQSLKRAWRTSDLFESALAGHVGKRTKEMGVHFAKVLTEHGVPEKKTREWTRAVAERFGKLKKDDGTDSGLHIEQLAHFSPEEWQAIFALADTLAARGEAPKPEELELLRKPLKGVDIALFGRMLADATRYNVEAAAQVAHAITVHKVAVEDDFFTAVDDLNTGEEDLGAGHMGETEFGAGLFYLYLCIDRRLLIENLGGDESLARRGLRALVEAAATVAPTGKQNSFASRARASYILCETGDQQPRSLSVAFLKPIGGQDMLTAAIDRIGIVRDSIDKAYGECSDRPAVMDVNAGTGTLSEIIACATE